MQVLNVSGDPAKAARFQATLDGGWGLRNEGASADDDGGGDSLVWGFNVGSAFQ
jgi:hypothetical protein